MSSTGDVADPTAGGAGAVTGADAGDKLFLPKSCIKRIMKLNDDVKVVSAESAVAVSKATEQFIELLVKRSYDICQQHSKRTLRFEDIVAAISDEAHADQFQFLYEAFGKTK